MKLLFFNHNVAWSGTFFRAYHLGRHLVRMGHEVTLVTTHPSRRLRFDAALKDGVHLVLAPDLLWGPARQGFDPTNAARRSWRLRRSRWDVVHAFDSRPVVIVPALQAARRGATLVMDWADWWGRGGTIEERSGWLVRTCFGPIEAWFEEAFRTRARGTTVISTALAERARGLGVDPATILRIPHGCDVTEFALVERDDARARLGLAAGPLIAHLGTLLPGDAALLFEAFRRLRARRAGVRLVLIGRPRVAVPADLARSGAIVETGFVPYDLLQTWLGAADVAVVPLEDTIANRGRWPSKVNDCLAAGRAVVITGVGDAAGFVSRAGAGWVAPAEAGGLAETLALSLEAGVMRDAAGRRARGLAETELAWSGLAATLAALYGQLAASRARAA